MTRTSLTTTLRRLYVFLSVLLLLSLVAKFKAYIPGLAGTPASSILADLYEFLRDMSLLIATGGVAYLTNVFQKRSGFTKSLEEEWRGIVRTKAGLVTFCEKPFPSTDDFLAAYASISCTIDNMRIVYRNVGETDDLIGLYPYSPLHDMRRVLLTLDPRKRQDITPEERHVARDAILQVFYALRETFLEELDLEEPDDPLLSTALRRRKMDGATSTALRQQQRQSDKLMRHMGPRPEIDELLRALRHAEQSGVTRNVGQSAAPMAPARI